MRDFLLRPFVSAVLASLLTAILMAPQGVPVIHERTVVQRIPGTTKTITIVQKVCDTRTVERLLNEVLHVQATTGDSKVDNAAKAQAKGEVSSAQSGNAQSGDAVVGQIVSALAVCGTVNVTANNHVENSKAETGDAEVDNDSDIVLQLPTPHPHKLHTTRTTEPSVSPALSELTPTP